MAVWKLSDPHINFQSTYMHFLFVSILVYPAPGWQPDKSKVFNQGINHLWMLQSQI